MEKPLPPAVPPPPPPPPPPAVADTAVEAQEKDPNLVATRRPSLVQEPGIRGSDVRGKICQTCGFSPDNVPCQICGESDHRALDCFHRMDLSYQGRQPPSKLAAMAHRSSLSKGGPSNQWSPYPYVDPIPPESLHRDVHRGHNFHPRESSPRWPHLERYQGTGNHHHESNLEDRLHLHNGLNQEQEHFPAGKEFNEMPRRYGRWKEEQDYCPDNYEVDRMPPRFRNQNLVPERLRGAGYTGQDFDSRESLPLRPQRDSYRRAGYNLYGNDFEDRPHLHKTLDQGQEHFPSSKEFSEMPLGSRPWTQKQGYSALDEMPIQVRGRYQGQEYSQNSCYVDNMPQPYRDQNQKLEHYSPNCEAFDMNRSYRGEYQEQSYHTECQVEMPSVAVVPLPSSKIPYLDMGEAPSCPPSTSVAAQYLEAEFANGRPKSITAALSTTHKESDNQGGFMQPELPNLALPSLAPAPKSSSSQTLPAQPEGVEEIEHAQHGIQHQMLPPSSSPMIAQSPRRSPLAYRDQVPPEYAHGGGYRGHNFPSGGFQPNDSGRGMSSFRAQDGGEMASDEGESGPLVYDNVVIGDSSNVVIGEGNQAGRRGRGRVSGNIVMR